MDTFKQQEKAAAEAKQAEVQRLRALSQSGSGTSSPHRRFGSAVETCFLCKKAAYPTESMTIEIANDTLLIHNACFRCSTCNAKLSKTTFTSFNRQLYCKPCYEKAKRELKFEAKPQEEKTTNELSSKFVVETEKCHSCGKNVYPQDRLVIEFGSDTQIWHQPCFKCQFEGCATKLNPTSFVSFAGKPYCKSHYERVKRELKFEAKPAEEKTTNELSSKFVVETEKCHSCQKNVYPTDRLVIEFGSETQIWHQPCFKCQFEGCATKLNPTSFVSFSGKPYCKSHYERVKRELKLEKKSGEGTTNELSSKFVVETEKCQSCQKTVYPQDRLVIEFGSETQIWHQPCFKCQFEGCATKLNPTSFVSFSGKPYCKSHYERVKRELKLEKKSGDATTNELSSKFVVEADKCYSCGKNVYPIDKLTVEAGSETQIWHEACFKCQFEGCATKLNPTSYVSFAGKPYCKSHYERVKRELKLEKKTTGDGTTNELSSKFVVDTEKCTMCGKSVYPIDQLTLEVGAETLIFHEACFKCQFEGCSTKLNASTFVSFNDKGVHKFFCRPHYEQVKRELQLESKNVIGSSQASEMFKSDTEECEVCNKRIFPEERLLIEAGSATHLFHKWCFKCVYESCGITLNPSTFVSYEGSFLCRPHYDLIKTQSGGRLEQVKIKASQGQLKRQASMLASGNSPDASPKREKEDLNGSSPPPQTQTSEEKKDDEQQDEEKKEPVVEEEKKEEEQQEEKKEDVQQEEEKKEEVQQEEEKKEEEQEEEKKEPVVEEKKEEEEEKKEEEKEEEKKEPVVEEKKEEEQEEKKEEKKEEEEEKQETTEEKKDDDQ